MPACCSAARVAQLYAAEYLSLARVFLLDEWEVDGKVVDMTAFRGQFAGRAMGEELVLGENVDGITGATKSVEGLVEELNEVRESQPSNPWNCRLGVPPQADPTGAADLGGTSQHRRRCTRRMEFLDNVGRDRYRGLRASRRPRGRGSMASGCAAHHCGAIAG